MKIMLEKDIVGLGKQGDIKDVREGYFRNFLLPNKLAILATKEKIKEREKDSAVKERNKKISEEKTESDMEKLSGQTIVLGGKVNEKGSLYKAITAKDIVKKLSESGFKEIRASWVIMEKPLKEAGKSEIEIKTPSGKIVKIIIEVLKQR